MPTTDTRSWYRWQVVAMLWAISFFNYADRQAIFSVFPLLQKQMGLSTIELGLLGSSFAWVYGLCAMFAGLIVDWEGAVTSIFSAVFCFKKNRQLSNPANFASVSSVVVLGKCLYSTFPQIRRKVLALNETPVSSKIS